MTALEAYCQSKKLDFGILTTKTSFYSLHDIFGLPGKPKRNININNNFKQSSTNGKSRHPYLQANNTRENLQRKKEEEKGDFSEHDYMMQLQSSSLDFYLMFFFSGKGKAIYFNNTQKNHRCEILQKLFTKGLKITLPVNQKS